MPSQSAAEGGWRTPCSSQERPERRHGRRLTHTSVHALIMRPVSVLSARLVADVREMVVEQREYRELLVRITARDLLLRYKQTVMGFGWAVFMPLVNTAVFSVIFTRVAPLDTGMPYPLYAFCGLLAWNFSASSFRFAVGSLTTNTTLVTKVYFPREIFPVSAVL